MNDDILIGNFVNYKHKQLYINLMDNYFNNQIDAVTFTEEFIRQRNKDLHLASDGSLREELLQEAKKLDPLELAKVEAIVSETFLDCDFFWVDAEEDTPLEFSEPELRTRLGKAYQELKNA
jgi:hypothetical protein